MSYRDHAIFSEETGFSLLESMLGVFLMLGILQGAYLLSRTSIKSNRLGQDLYNGSAVLKSFVEETRGLNIDSIPRNAEQVDSVSGFVIRWRAYDNSSSVPYQQPAGLLLLCAKLTYVRQGRTLTQETTTLLGRE